MFQILMASALSLDAFTASLACGASKTKMPLSAMLVISVVCTAFLALSAGVGTGLGRVIPSGVTAVISFIMLFSIGLIKSFESFLKRRIKKWETGEGRFSIRLFDVRFVLTVYADSEKADMDNSKTLSVREAVYLAAALSLDGLAAGLGWGLGSGGYLFLIGLSLASNFLAVALGYLLGKTIAKTAGLDISWLGGVILILLSFFKLGL